MLFGVGDDELRGAIRDAHDRAVDEALGYLERDAGVTRRGPGGVQRDRRPRVRRGGVPASDVARRRSAAAHARPRRQPDARRGRALVDARRAPDLRARQDRRLPVRGAAAGAAHARARGRVGAGAQRDRRHRRRAAGGAAGVQPAACGDRGRAGSASGRRAPAPRRSRRSRRGARRTTGVTPERLAPEWRERARRARARPRRRCAASLGRADGARARTRRGRRASPSGSAGPDGLTAERSTFTRRDVLQAFVRAGCRPAPTSRIGELERVADGFLGVGARVVLADGEPRARADDVDGRTIPTVRARAALLDAGAAGARAADLDYARRRDGARRGVGASRAVERALERRPTLADEQAAMVRRLVLDGDGVAVVVGQAGHGQDVRARRRARGVGGERPPRASARRWRGGPRASSRTAPASRARASPRCSTSSAPAAERRCGGGPCWCSTRPGWCRRATLAELVEHVERARSEARAGRRSPAAAGDRRRRRVPRRWRDGCR